jgi:hypothetical protein
MIKKISFYLTLSLASVYFLSGCGKKYEEASDQVSGPQKLEAPLPATAPAEESMNADNASGSGTTDFISSTAASQPKGDSVRKFIRTANVKFKVNNVIRTTSTIEDIVGTMGGFVAHTNLTSNRDNKTLVPISEDSSLETTYYTVTNSMTLRVPDTRLDSTLRAIAANVEYLDYRIISAQDVSLDFLANRMAEERLGKQQKRLEHAIDKRGKKLRETIDGEEQLAGRTEEIDSRKLSTLSMIDRVKFSTVQLDIYQRQAIAREMLPNDLNIAAYEPGFGTKLENALEYGWDIFATFILGLAKLWGFILFGIIIVILYKRFKPMLVKKEVVPVSVGQK